MIFLEVQQLRNATTPATVTHLRNAMKIHGLRNATNTSTSSIVLCFTTVFLDLRHAISPMRYTCNFATDGRHSFTSTFHHLPFSQGDLCLLAFEDGPVRASAVATTLARPWSIVSEKSSFAFWASCSSGWAAHPAWMKRKWLVIWAIRTNQTVEDADPRSCLAVGGGGGALEPSESVTKYPMAAAEEIFRLV